MGKGSIVTRLALSVAFAATGLFVACDDDEEDVTNAAPEVESEEQATTDDVLFEADPIELLGEEVTVAVEVDNVLSDHAFDIATTRPTAEQFIVVYAQDQRFEEGDTVLVTGVVQPFNTENAESDLGIELDDEALRRYEGAYAIVAESLEMDQNNASS